MEAPHRIETATSSESSDDEFPLRQQIVVAELPSTESTATEWTNEKHSLYLKSMEASFVNQLYDSMELLSWRIEKPDSLYPKARQTDTTAYSPSGQFKVLRDGCWKKINFERPDLPPNKAVDSHGFLKSPWIQHFRPASRLPGLATPDFQSIAASRSHAISAKGKKTLKCASAGTPKQSQTFCPYFGNQIVDGNAEASDQNFVDEDIEGEKVSSICSAKKAKTSETDSSSNDQVVPFSKHGSKGDAGERSASSSRRSISTVNIVGTP